MSSPIFESLEVPEMIELTAGAKCKKSKSGQRRVKSRETGRCRLPCPTYCRPPLSEEEKAERKAEKLYKKYEQAQDVADKALAAAEEAGALEPETEASSASPGPGAAAANAFGAPTGGGYYPRFRGGEFEGGEIEGGVRHKRKMTKYNMFVKKYAAAHRNMSGKSLIRSAAKSWNKCKRSGSRSCSPRRR